MTTTQCELFFLFHPILENLIIQITDLLSRSTTKASPFFLRNPIPMASFQPAPDAPLLQPSSQAPTYDPALPAHMRAGLRRFAKAVFIVSCTHHGARNAMAATAVTELSLDPPSMLICVNKTASMHAALIEGAAFCLNILHPSHQRVAGACSSGTIKGEGRFEEGDWAGDGAGTPYLRDAQARFFCEVDGGFSYGTHDVFVGRVTGANVAGSVNPLVYVDGTYVTLESKLQQA